MGVPKRLTEKQIKFAQLVVANEGRMNGTECAKEAGYGEAARIRAYELQNPKKYPLVVKYIGELREENQRKYSVNCNPPISSGGTKASSNEPPVWDST